MGCSGALLPECWAAVLKLLAAAGLEADGVTTSHPLTISRHIQQLSEIDNWFDDVSYAKGGAVLRMLRAWLNRGQGPQALGFGSSGAGGDAAAADLHQHMHRRMLLLQQAAHGAAAGGAASGLSSSSSSSSSSLGWRRQLQWQQQQHRVDGPADDMVSAGVGG